MSDGQYFLDTRRKILATRARACGEFRALGFDFPEPSGNFLFVRHKERHAAEIFDGQVRLSIGIEDADDLIADLDQALSLI